MAKELGYPPYSSKERECSFINEGFVHDDKVTWCEELKDFLCKECCIKREGHNCVWWNLCFGRR